MGMAARQKSGDRKPKRVTAPCTSPYGGIGRRAGFRFLSREGSRFDSGYGYAAIVKMGLALNGLCSSSVAIAATLARQRVSGYIDVGL